MMKVAVGQSLVNYPSMDGRLFTDKSESARLMKQPAEDEGVAEELLRGSGLLQKQRRLIQLVLRGQEEPAFFQRLMDIIETPFAVVGPRRELLFNAISCRDEDLLKGWPWQAVVRRLQMQSGEWLRVPFAWKDGGIGFVVYYCQGEELPRDEEGLFVQAAEAAAHHLNMLRLTEAGRTPQADLGELLARYIRREVTEGVLTVQMETAGIHVLRGTFQCMLTQAAADGEGDGAGFPGTAELIRALESCPALGELELVHLAVGDAVLTICGAQHFVDSGRLVQIAIDALQRMEDQELRPKLRISVSGRKTRSAFLRQAYEECTDAFRLAQQLGTREQVIRFDSVDLAYVFRHVPVQEMRGYGEEVLEALLAKEPEYAHEMMRTLEAYLLCDGQIHEAAKRLFVHRNTVAYRLEKISDILDVDFKRIDDLLRLKLAFMFRRIADEDSAT
ncbi:helix-turn-helix domain-containing protein [Paenibacillus filicis]|uniref:Helix-turn-helix domain-containing protein n=1 Tax=Paenibacillus filicis TaxID=669464 RepID=A0ABU9DTH0_9BACL